ncbi:glycosyltransferase family 2 protein [Ramlibacter rhizophilus]|uniref:Glycosyltransferase family 2 protein n=1 Tax=Ramlibacter rhizophilus TaxID=1781167 RepID=A0A4Z0BXZ5_9BURK|nr:glycosyltransferase family 2 protein [Ramlibacter rhizophilus]
MSPGPQFSYSVVVPYGKIGGNTARCLLSILEQSYPPEEVVIVCNGPVKASDAEQVLRAALSSSSIKCRLLEAPDSCKNANAARNLGAKCVSTPWVAFLDSDDWWDVDWAQTCARALNNADKDVRFVYGSINVHRAGGLKETLTADDWRVFATPENYLLAYRPAQTSTYMVASSLLHAVLWREDLGRHQDYDFFVRCMNSGALSCCVKEPQVNVEWTYPRRHKYHYDCWRVVKDWAPRVDPEFYRRHLANLTKSALLSKDLEAIGPLVRALCSAWIRQIGARQARRAKP